MSCPHLYKQCGPCNRRGRRRRGRRDLERLAEGLSPSPLSSRRASNHPRQVGSSPDSRRPLPSSSPRACSSSVAPNRLFLPRPLRALPVPHTPLRLSPSASRWSQHLLRSLRRLHCSPRRAADPETSFPRLHHSTLSPHSPTPPRGMPPPSKLPLRQPTVQLRRPSCIQSARCQEGHPLPRTSFSPQVRPRLYRPRAGLTS